MDPLSSALAVLTAMITPSVLISACGALILSTSTRLGLVGSGCLFYGSVLLIFEARLALSTINAEMDFIWRLGQALAPRDLTDKRSPHFNRLTLRRPRV